MQYLLVNFHILNRPAITVRIGQQLDHTSTQSHTCTSIHSLTHSHAHSPAHSHPFTNSLTSHFTHSHPFMTTVCHSVCMQVPLTSPCHSHTHSITHSLTHSHPLIQTISLSLVHIQYLSSFLFSRTAAASVLVLLVAVRERLSRDLHRPDVSDRPVLYNVQHY